MLKATVSATALVGSLFPIVAGAAPASDCTLIATPEEMRSLCRAAYKENKLPPDCAKFFALGQLPNQHKECITDPDYYVSEDGNDSNPGSITKPWKTITKATSVVSAGNTVHVLAGTYNETVAMNRSGTDSQRIRFVSDVKWGARIIPTNSTTTHIFRITGSYVDVDGFEMAPAGNNIISVGVDTTGTNNSFRHNKIHDINKSGNEVGSAIGVGGTDSIIDSNLVYNSGHSQLDHNIYVYTGHGHHITNNIVGNAAGWNITLWHDAYEIYIYNNTVFNGRTALGSNGGGILIGAGEHPDSNARNCIVANNIVYDNRGDGIAEGGIVHNNRYINNLLYKNDWGDFSLHNGTQTGTIIADPKLVAYNSSGIGDYHPQPLSPAIDKALKEYAPAIDFDTRPRLPADIGALEEVTKKEN